MKNATPDYYCRQKAAQSGSSFYYSFLFLNPKQRQAIQAVYAFCREVDDIVDECSDHSVAQAKLAWWHTEIDQVYAGKPSHPVGKALMNTLSHYPLDKKLFQAILLGMEMDLTYQGYQTFSDLQIYCERVASAVGLLAVEIFGYQESATLEYARLLGIAFQLVNIIRDIGEDAHRLRIYLPEEELHQFSLTSDTLFNKQYSENFIALMQFQANRARDFYAQALTHLPKKDQFNQKSGLIMANIYFALLDEIEKSKFQVLHQRIALTPLMKLWIAWKSHRRLKKTFQP